MFLENATVDSVTQIGTNVFLLKLISEKIAYHAKPGQFVNIKVSDSDFPLLRRPFSICETDGDSFSIMFVSIGGGTSILQNKQHGETIDVMGPLGNGFYLNDDFDKAIIVAGGIGAAPFPFLIKELVKSGKEISCFTGGRTKDDCITYEMKNVSIATDDGSLGFKGNVVELLASKIDPPERGKNDKIKIFGCGPNAMLKALQKFCISNNIDGDISTESSMACGFGICQGCPVESTTNKDKYLLVCKDGPVFNVKDIELP
ncbi:MAG: dihydroorotate dehydrogenase electron transfer subunit [Ignavibacteria bacterium]|nr:dihydroorotate dehydrogenase electron transfer subunit [Ignavibacteria bacterium]